jgi:hypothetical protein
VSLDDTMARVAMPEVRIVPAAERRARLVRLRVHYAPEPLVPGVTSAASVKLVQDAVESMARSKEKEKEKEVADGGQRS